MSTALPLAGLVASLLIGAVLVLHLRSTRGRPVRRFGEAANDDEADPWIPLGDAARRAVPPSPRPDAAE
ncbi:hypothetical protein [Salinarimonas soli]|uniref:Uncharacterized protein n=1 Tax=Salinarimonas soli TaxID=1638099 RepID=A0A5B2VFS4_9HYPH|nr:hypothetical protein [Salinarimonas soli]KAA2237715.1 hypothetical protein F0L46_08535 [Salinarimonas soli]